jgi:hypothetical protein
MPTTIAADDRKPIPAIPPLSWKKEIPKYRISHETLPAPKSRFRFEPPFAQISDASTWQYGEKMWPAGSVIETTEWPNPGTMTPLNYSARQVMDFFTSRQRSRLPRAPWFDNQVRLEDGLGGPQPKITTPRPEPVDLHPRQTWPGLF